MGAQPKKKKKANIKAATPSNYLKGYHIACDLRAHWLMCHSLCYQRSHDLTQCLMTNIVKSINKNIYKSKHTHVFNKSDQK